MVDEAIDQGDDAGGVGEYFAPLCEGAVGCHHGALVFITPADEFEQQVGMAVGVGQVANLVDDQQAGACVMVQAPSQRGIAVEGGEVAQQLAGAGEQHGVAVDQRLIGDVAGKRRFADAVWADQNDVGGVLEEVERHQGFEGGAVAALGPVPVEVADRFEAADTSLTQAALQAAAGPLLLLPVDQAIHPAFGGDLRPMGQQAVELEGLGARLQGVEIIHRFAP